MGRIKTKQTKRLTKMLMAETEGFTTDFEKNKKVIEQNASAMSKKMRNTIAGYATRLVKEEQAKQV